MASEELERVKAVYRERMARGLSARYSLLHPGELYMAQERERRMLALLSQCGIGDLARLRILEIGCGRGLPLLDWVRWGAHPDNLAGIDVMEPLLQHATAIIPAAALAAASGGSLPFRDGTFDLVTQLTVFSSILDRAMREAVAAEMLRVARPGGSLLWFDVRVTNPSNPNLLAMRRRDIQRLFPGCSVVLRSSTLAPPLARRLAPLSFLICAMLSSIPILRTHYIALIVKPKGTGQ